MTEAAGLYVHVPFCSAICPYCDFAVVRGRPEKRRGYVETLLAEICLVDDFPHAIDTIYLGGGTPSYLEDDDLARILDALRRTFHFEGEPRVHLEVNPEDVTADTSGERTAAWRRLGVAFLSLGVQSFDADRLGFLGRRHSPEEARGSVEAALAAGFETVSVDLIYGLPGETAGAWHRDLHTAIDLAPGHFSCYELEVHERTTFGKKKARGELIELPDAAQAERFEQTHTELAAAGYDAYEVSNFARGPQHRSRHNRKYWYHVPYLGLGPSAHSFDGERRFWNEPLLPRWQKRVASGERPIAGEERLTPHDRALEELMLTLRTPEGVDLAGFSKRHGVDLVAMNAKLLAGYENDGLLEVTDGRLRPSLRGWAVADGLAGSFALEPKGDEVH